MIIDDEVWAGYCNGDIVVWDRKTGAMVREILGHGNEVLALLHCKGTVWIGSNDWEVKVRNRQTGSLLKVLADGHRDWVRSLLEVAGHVWSTGDDRICIWDGEFGDKMKTIEVKAKVRCICMVGGDTWAGCADGSVRVFSRGGKYLSKFSAHRSEITSILCVGVHVWTGAVDKLVKIWDRDTKKQVDAIDFGAPVAALALVGTQVWVGGRGTVKVHPAAGITEWLVQHTDNLAHQLAVVSKERDELEHKVHECNSLLAQKEDELKQQLEHFARIEGNSASLIRGLEQKAEEKEVTITANRNDYKVRLAEKDTDISAQREKIVALQNDTRDKREWIAKMEAEKRGMDEEIARLKALLNTAQSENNDMIRELQAHIDKVKLYKANLTDKEKEIAQLKSEHESTSMQKESEANLKRALADMEKRFVSKNAELEGKEKELTTKVDEFAKIEQLNSTLKEQMDALREEKQSGANEFSSKLQKVEQLCKEHYEEKSRLYEQNRKLAEAAKKLEEELELNKELPKKLQDMELEISRLQTGAGGFRDHEQFTEQLRILEQRAGVAIAAEDVWQTRVQEYNKLVAQAHTIVDSIHNNTAEQGDKQEPLSRFLCVLFLCFVLLMLLCFIFVRVRMDSHIGLRKVPWPN